VRRSEATWREVRRLSGRRVVVPGPWPNGRSDGSDAGRHRPDRGAAGSPVGKEAHLLQNACPEVSRVAAQLRGFRAARNPRDGGRHARSQLSRSAPRRYSGVLWVQWSRTAWNEIGSLGPGVGPATSRRHVFGIAFKLLMKAIVMPQFGGPSDQPGVPLPGPATRRAPRGAVYL